jgi:hypothetical protein
VDVWDSCHSATRGTGTAGARHLTEPRVAGERVAAFSDSRHGVQRPVVIDPAIARRHAVRPPSTAMPALAADETTVAWLANGCVLAAGAGDVPPVDVVPPERCPRAEVVLDDYDPKLRGRTLRVGVHVHSGAAARVSWRRRA